MRPLGLADNVIYQAGEFSKEFSQLLTSQFKAQGFNISSEQFSILVVLWYQDGLTQKELSNQLNRDKTTISRVINTMIKEEWIGRHFDEQDKRIRKIKLTEKGKTLQEKLVKISGDLYMQAIQGIPESSIHIAALALRRMRKNLI